MDAVFVELPAFERNRSDYFDEESFAGLLNTLMANPSAGDVIEGTGGLRKLRFADMRRGKGKRGGLRIIYYFWTGGPEFWLFTVFDKNEASDLSPRQREALREALKKELKARSTS
jgi:hypothetical protein